MTDSYTHTQGYGIAKKFVATQGQYTLNHTLTLYIFCIFTWRPAIMHLTILWSQLKSFAIVSTQVTIVLQYAGTGPTDSTVVDFWRMVWQLHCPSIVMMTNLEEGRKKCERYWPQFGTADYGPYIVTLAEEKPQADYTIRKLTLTVSTIMNVL